MHVAVWLSTAAALSIFAASCGDRGTVTAPSTTPAPTLPTPTSPVPPPGSPPVVTGSIVYEYTAAGRGRPVPNLRLEVFNGSAYDGVVGGTRLPDVVTDANGRFAIAGVTTPVYFVRTAPGSAYRFLCDYFPANYLDLPVVHVSWSGDRPPPSMGTAGTSVYGIVKETVNGRAQPVAGATVTLDSGTQDPPATTTATGFYMICSVVGTDQDRTISARKDGYTSTTRKFVGGWDILLDLELARSN